MNLYVPKIAPILLSIHIVCGFISLLSALGAMLSTKGKSKHLFFGKLFFYAMTGVFITAIPLSIITSNLFLFLIALFSYYLALSGWRYAKNRLGKPIKFDWIISILMVLISGVMICRGIYYLSQNNGIILLVFGIIGGSFSIVDIRTYLACSAVGKQRIAKHLGAMLGATIAALTAFSVTNIPIKPEIILWFGPTVLIVPIISWWKRKISLEKSNS